MMTMALLCRLPDDLEDLSVLASNLHTTNFSNMLHDSLLHFPRQEKVSWDVIGDIVDFIVVVQNEDLMKENQEKLLKLPVCKWKSQIDDWTSSGLGGKRNNEPYAWYINELQEVNWPICKKIARTLKKGPS